MGGIAALGRVLLSDDDAAVRVAAVGICGWCGTWIGIGRPGGSAVPVITQTSALASSNARRLLPFIQRSHPDELRPIILR